jgi:IMP dehydrogenase/GMP reductase
MNNLFTLDDIVLIPAVFNKIKHRSQCSPYVREHSLLPGTNSKLPLFTAPMSCVINDENYTIFKNNGINTIIPRNIDINIRLKLAKDTFVALGLEEFETLIDNNDSLPHKMFILIDIANGHMEQLYILSKLAKEKYGDNLVLMVGNIANPQTYLEYSAIGVDFVRVGIGTGNVCTTSANGGIHYPMGSLLADITNCKLLAQQNFKTKNIKFANIVADGGFNNFDQINKALALGADFVMLGKIFAKAEEACGEIIDFPNYDEEETSSRYREYYGMSTKRAQVEFGKKGNKTAEGISTLVQIDYTIAGWVDNFKHYLQSAMSYTDCVTLDEFKTKVRYSTITPNARMAYFK